MNARSIVPPERPRIERDAVVALLAAADLDPEAPAIVGRRGYYRDTMGLVGRNDVRIYDDALVVISPTVFRAYNANTDPSRLHPDVAVLTAGVWRYQLGTHGLSKPVEEQYPALVQADDVVVLRPRTDHYPIGAKHPTKGGQHLGDGKWRGRFGINHHRGGWTTTSSEGCQTIYPPQWDEYLALVEGEMAGYGVPTIAYLLTENASIAE